MTIVTVFFVVALILALVDELRSQGQSLAGWAAFFIAIGLLWGELA